MSPIWSELMRDSKQVDEQLGQGTSGELPLENSRPEQGMDMDYAKFMALTELAMSNPAEFERRRQAGYYAPEVVEIVLGSWQESKQ